MTEHANNAPVEATAADMPAVVDDLAAAFAGDVLFDWLLRDDKRRDRARRVFFDALVRRVGLGTACIERPVDGGGAAIWLPPEATDPISLFRQIQLAPAMLYATGGRRMARLLALQSAIDAQRPMHRPYAYLWFIGVRPELQGRGIGSRMLDSAHARLDNLGLPAFLETQTERNVTHFRNHGYEVTAQFLARPDAPPMWGLWREPQKTLF
jgi:ribosomal protein S18 acetylase RimI-like enzyme